MDKDGIRVSIIIATYNRAHLIKETLVSIQNQTDANWECLIIDDGGTDNTAIVIHPFLETDARFKFSKRPDTYLKGLPGCRNYGLDIAQGDFIIFFDDDDVVHPQNLEICAEVLNDKNIDFVHYQKEPFINELPIIEKQVISLKEVLAINNIEKIVTQQIGLASCTVLWKKVCFDKIRFNEKLMYAEEWECYCRIFLNGHKGIMLSNVLYYNRKHPQSNTGEFWSGNNVRIQSKKHAAVLLTQNIVEAKYMTSGLLKYFCGLAIAYRDYNLLKEILDIIKPKKEVLFYVKLKFYMFPLWKFYKRINKK